MWLPVLQTRRDEALVTVVLPHFFDGIQNAIRDNGQKMLVYKPNISMRGNRLLPRHHVLLFGTSLAICLLDANLLVNDDLVCSAAMKAEPGRRCERTVTMWARVLRGMRGARNRDSKLRTATGRTGWPAGTA